MAQTESEAAAEYRPQMDGKSHEKGYDAFTHFTTVGTVSVVCIVVGLAVGGVKHAWLSALFMIFGTLVAAGIGLVSPTISWRAPAALLGLLLLMMLLY